MMFHKVDRHNFTLQIIYNNWQKYVTKCSNRLQIPEIPGDFMFYQFYLKASVSCVNNGQKFLLCC